jgi:taspase (threonine aspartase 1)
MACSISGIGEEIIRANLAKSISDVYAVATDLHELLQKILVELFWGESLGRLLSDKCSCICGSRAGEKTWCA